MYFHLTIRPRLRTAAVCLGIVASTVVLLCRPDAAAGGVSRGLSICASVIIPTLFPFLVLGGFLARSGIAAAIGNRLERPIRRLFGLPGCCAAGILIAFLGGYPAGGAVVGDLYRSGQITADEGRRMLRFCVCGGPGFVISTVGAGLMNSTTLGLLLFAAQLLAALTIGVLQAPKKQRLCAAPARRVPVRALPAFVDSVTAACQTLLSMCGFLVLFAALLAIADTFLPTDNRLLGVLIACLSEVSCGCIAAARLPLIAPVLLAFTVGFGGLSVHCQLAAALHDTPLITPRFFIARLLHGVLTVLFTLLLLRTFPVTVPVFGGGSGAVITAFSGGVGLSVFLLLLCGIWLFYIDKKVASTYN